MSGRDKWRFAGSALGSARRASSDRRAASDGRVITL